MDQPELLRHTIRSLDDLKVPYMLVGSFASTTYGEPRFTQDIDIVIDLPSSLIMRFCAAFPAPDFFLSPEAVVEAVRTRFQFNVLHPGSGNKVDFILPRDDDWGREQLRRRRRVTILPGLDADSASPEDVILGKLWYYSLGESDKHLRDIAGMLKVSGTRIDHDDIAFWADRLGVADAWRVVLARIAGDPT